jgi:hypothetical protein
MGVTGVGSGVVGGLQPSSSIVAHALRDNDKNGKVSRGDLPSDLKILSPQQLGTMIAARPEKYLLLGEAHDAPDPKTVTAVFDELKRKNIPFVYGVEVPTNFRDAVLKYNEGKSSDKEFAQDFEFFVKANNGQYNADAMRDSMIAAHRAGGNIALLDASKSAGLKPSDRDPFMADKLAALSTQRVRNEDGSTRPLLPPHGKVVATLGAMHTQENVTPAYKKAAAEMGEYFAKKPAANLLAEKVGKDQVFSAFLYPKNTACLNDQISFGAGAWDAVVPRDVKAEFGVRVSETLCKVGDALR